MIRRRLEIEQDQENEFVRSICIEAHEKSEGAVTEASGTMESKPKGASGRRGQQPQMLTGK